MAFCGVCGWLDCECSEGAAPVFGGGDTLARIRLAVTDWGAGELTSDAAMRTIRTVLEDPPLAAGDRIWINDQCFVLSDPEEKP